MNVLSKSMAIVLSLIAGSQAMDVPRNELPKFNDLNNIRELTLTEKKNVHKMMLMKELQPNLHRDTLTLIMGEA